MPGQEKHEDASGVRGGGFHERHHKGTLPLVTHFEPAKEMRRFCYLRSFLDGSAVVAAPCLRLPRSHASRLATSEGVSPSANDGINDVARRRTPTTSLRSRT